jgi:hypothetical protein
MNLILGVKYQSAKALEGFSVIIRDENEMSWALVPSTAQHKCPAYFQRELRMSALLVDNYLRIIKSAWVREYMQYLFDSEQILLTQLKATNV